ncbi:zinc finger CCCH domain-containing protein 55-like [Arachis stenosperma]|uniref:zinc finger CCCH domain-containing protein 55-like n=1 Tax=Arachis stenosperma TaxID=217475 RepID=UPI0025AC1514|nr:zinc finger CCCH domain-containing protein 55-like [Arachis stenosperma]
MGSFEATNVVVARINKLDPENASKIIGHILFNLQEPDLLRLASTPDYVLHNLVLRIKTHLGLSSSSPSSPSNTILNNHLPPRHPTTSPATTPNNNSSSSNNPFSRFSTGNNLLPGLPNNPISPNSSFSVSRDSIYGGSVSKSKLSLSPRVRSDGAGDSFVDEQEMGDYLSFLNESLNNNKDNEDAVDPIRLDLGHGAVNNNGDGHFFHRRSYSASDAFFGVPDEEVGIGYKPCLYFARGFCKNGTNCNFVHHHDAVDNAAIVDSPTMEEHEALMSLKAAHHQRLMAASQLMSAGAAPTPMDKYINFSMLRRNDPQRAAAAAAVMTAEEFNRFARYRQESIDILGIASAERPNSPSRQIYLTFPAESTFKDEDVSEYFSKFGPVHDVRIPYQQKRMFGFVTFVYSETVRLILSKGNPHFICDSRVLVKPYKEKGKIVEKRQHQPPHIERVELSPCLSPSELEFKAPHDFRLGARMLYNPQEILLRRKLEEQVDFQQAIELQERRLMNLHLPDFKNNHLCHHQRSLSFGATLPSSQLQGHISSPRLYSDSIREDMTGFTGSLVSTAMASAAAVAPQQQEVDLARIHDNCSRNGKDGSQDEIIDVQNSIEHALPDNLFTSPTKATRDDPADFSSLAEVNESAVFSTCSSSQIKLEPKSALSDMASH